MKSSGGKVVSTGMSLLKERERQVSIQQHRFLLFLLFGLGLSCFVLDLRHQFIMVILPFMM